MDTVHRYEKKTKQNQQLKRHCFLLFMYGTSYHSSLLIRMGRENSCPVLKAPTNQTLIGNHSKPPYFTKHNKFKVTLFLILVSQCVKKVRHGGKGQVVMYISSPGQSSKRTYSGHGTGLSSTSLSDV